MKPNLFHLFVVGALAWPEDFPTNATSMLASLSSIDLATIQFQSALSNWSFNDIDVIWQDDLTELYWSFPYFAPAPNVTIFNSEDSELVVCYLEETTAADFISAMNLLVARRGDVSKIPPDESGDDISTTVVETAWLTLEAILESLQDYTAALLRVISTNQQPEAAAILAQMAASIESAVTVYTICIDLCSTDLPSRFLGAN